LAAGRPIGTAPVKTSPAPISCELQPTAVSVGPYSLMSREAGACCCQNAIASAVSASPPMTKARVRPAA
jgi:hypothetical protein